jgi:hypothetical protein
VDEGAAHVYDLTLQSLFEDAEIAWTASEAGVEAKVVYKESEFLIQMRPWIFCIPSCTEPVYMPEALTVNEDRAALLSGDRLASGLSPAKLLVRVLSQDLASPPEVVVSGSGVSELLVPLDRKRRVFSLEGLVDYGARHGVTYFKPRGFVRWRRMVDPEKWATIKDWPVVYHGSSLANTTRILEDGLRRPSDGQVAHGQAGSSSHKTIYLSPAIGVASHPVYSAFFKIADNRWGQTVLQCRVRPGSYKSQPHTLRNEHFDRKLRIDPNFETLDDLEFLVEDPADVVVTGLLYREFGAHADGSLFGDLATRVVESANKPGKLSGPEYVWTKLLEDDFRSKGLFL